MEISHGLFALDILIGFGLVYLIRKQDIYHPESLAHMALATIFGGIASIVLVLGLAHLLQSLGFYQAETVLDEFLFTGPLEETAKLVGFFLVLKVFRIRLDEPVDAVVYMSCVALGFSLIENFLYALSSPLVLGVRTVTSTPVHVFVSAVMAMVFAVNFDKQKSAQSLLKAIVVASALHGVHNSLLLLGFGMTKFYFAFLFFAVIWIRKLFGYTLLYSPHRKDLLSALTPDGERSWQLCRHCGKNSFHNVFRYGPSRLFECQTCEYTLLTKRESRKFLNFFLPHYSTIAGNNDHILNQVAASLPVYHDREFNSFFRFKKKEASEKVEDCARELRKAFENTVTFTYVFGTRPVLSRRGGLLNENYQKFLEVHDQKVDRDVLLLAAVIAFSILFPILIVILFRRSI